GLNFNISAAVGFISVLGVAVMNGLLFVSAFNGLRARGVGLREALVEGTRRLVPPVVMAALAAILGLVPAALSTKMGSESQKPLGVAPAARQAERAGPSRALRHLRNSPNPFPRRKDRNPPGRYLRTASVRAEVRAWRAGRGHAVPFAWPASRPPRWRAARTAP